MNWKTWIPLALAIVLGVVAAKVARDVLMHSRPAQTQAVKLAKVIVAKADILPGHELKPEDLVESQMSFENVPAGSFNDATQLMNRVAEQKMVKGQSILEGMLAPTGAAAGLQALVPKGQRAITIEVNEFSGVAGLLTPGCRVDVLATLQGDGKQIARTIVQNVKVTAVGQRVVMPTKDDNNPNQQPEIMRSITVLATLKDSEAIELAASTGRPRLVLRSSRDEDVVKSEGITIGELRGPDREGFWASAAKFLAALPKPTTMPATAVAAKQPTTKPEIETRVVKVFRAGAPSDVTLEINRKDTVEAAAPDGSKGAVGQ